MKFILRSILSFITGLFTSSPKTRDSLKDGSGGSTGSGVLKQNREEGATGNGKINWTYIIILLAVAMGTWFIPSPFSSCPTLGGRDFDTTVTAVRGVPDTTSRESERVSGSETGIIYVGTLDEISIIPEGLIGEREIIAGTEEGDTLQIRARTYLFYYERAQDSVDYYTETSIEWNLKPRPIEIITRIDTLKIEIPVPVKVPVPVPFIEQPAVVATITTAIIMGLIYGLREARK